eukprot:COSAG01_NODE_32785_length_575_cov_1.189076_2_plen_150_part_01
MTADGHGGALVQLGIDSILITSLERRKIDRFAMVLCLPVLFFIMAAGLQFVLVFWSDNLLERCWYLFAGLYSGAGGPSICFALFTMIVATTLANHEILQATQQVSEMSSSAVAWTGVEASVVHLATKSMPSLSHGFGRIMALFVATYVTF